VFYYFKGSQLQNSNIMNLKLNLKILFLTFCLFALHKGFAQISVEKNYIRIDQFGYLPNSTKFAVIAKAETGFNAGKGIDLDITKKVELRKTSDNSVVFDGLPSAWNGGTTDSYSGDKGWWWNFSAYTTVGEYYIRVYKTSGFAVDSYKFEISADVYANALKAAVNMFYYQRINQEKTAEFASGAKWVDGAWYERANQEKAATFLTDRTKTKDVSRGWFDAGDPNKYVTFALEPVHDLLTSYEHHKSMWDKFNLNIPESKNNIPDLLDEIKWEIDWLKNMQDDATGGLHIKAGILNDGAYISPPSSDTRTRYYDKLCPSSSIAGAGMMAHAAVNFKLHKDLETYSADLLKRAEAAWNYYETAPDKALRCDNGEIEAGDADGSGDHFALEHLAEATTAAVYLFALTGKQKYQDFIITNYQQARPYKAEDWGVYRSHQSSALLFYITLPNADPTVKNNIISRKTSAQKSTGSFYSTNEADNLYRARTIYPNWGSNSLISRQGADNMDFIAYNLLSSDHARFKEKGQAIINYLHGVNPLGMCYLSNMYQYGGDFCFDEMWHSWFNAGTKYDNIDGSNVGPAPGFLAGGFNKSTVTQMLVKVGTESFNAKVADQPTQKTFSNDNTGNASAGPWAYNEPAIYYNSGYVKLLAHFVAGNAAPIPVNNIAFSPDTATVQIDETLQLKPTISPSTATNQTVTWTSSDATIATISSTGLITGKKVGKATITVTTQDGNKTAKFTVNIVPVPTLESCGFLENNGFEAGLVKWINTNNAAIAGEPAKTGKKAAVVSAEGGVNYPGRFKVKAGNQINLKFWAKLEGSPLYPQVGIDFFDASGKEVLKETVPISGTDYKEYNKIKIIPDNAVEIGLWSYRGGNGGKMFLDDMCLLEEKAVNVAVTGVTLNASSATIKVDETLQVTATVAPANATNPAITWTSNRETVATVNSAGLISAKAIGTATITATTQDGSKTATVNITVEAAPPLATCGSVDNFGFESNFAKWDNVNNAVTIGTPAKSGSKAAIVSGDGGVNYQTKIAIAADKEFTYSAWSKIEGAPSAAMIGIDYFNANDVEISEDIMNVNSTEYKEYTMTKKTPANTAKIQIWTYKGGSGGKMFLDDFCFTIKMQAVVLSSEPNFNKEEAYLYPNPAQDFVNVMVLDKSKKSMQVELIDATGKSLINENFQLNTGDTSVKLRLNGVPNGLYFIKARQNELQKTFKLMKSQL
jgi:endoglucanase